MGQAGLCFNVFEGHMSYFWVTDTPVSDFLGDVSSWFQNQSLLPYLHCEGKRNVNFLRFTSGTTPADLFYGQRSQPKCYYQGGGGDIARIRKDEFWRVNTLPTELFRTGVCIFHTGSYYLEYPIRHKQFIPEWNGLVSENCVNFVIKLVVSLFVFGDMLVIID